MDENMINCIKITYQDMKFGVKCWKNHSCIPQTKGSVKLAAWVHIYIISL